MQPHLQGVEVETLGAGDDDLTVQYAARRQLRGQDMGPFEKFAAMIERNWDGIAAHSLPTHDVPLGFVEGLNNKIRVIQRRAYGLRDEEYLKLKILTSGLPELHGPTRNLPTKIPEEP